MEEIFIAEAARICGVDKRTFDKWVRKGLIKEVRKIPPGFRVFDKKDVIKLAREVPKDRRKGIPLILPKSTRKSGSK